MTVPFGLCATTSGVYYTPSFTTSGAITWSLLSNTGLPSADVFWMAVDPFDPRNRQYVGVSDGQISTAGFGAVCGRNGGNWTELIDITDAIALTGQAGEVTLRYLRGLWCDPTVQGSIYTCYYAGGGPDQHYILKSLDYGANWSVILAPGMSSRPLELQVYGSSIWFATHRDNINHTPNGGTNWYTATYGPGNDAVQGILVNPNNITEAYSNKGAAGDFDLMFNSYAAGVINSTEKQNGVFLANSVATGATDTLHGMWIENGDENHQRAIKQNGFLYHTHDKWGTVAFVDLSASIPATTNGQITHIQNSAGTEADIVVLSKISAGDNRIYVIDTENDATPTERNGIAPNNVPPAATYIAHYGLWVGYAPVNSGVYVYADEMGDITDIPDADNLGLPLFGDRSSWRDYDADTDGAGTELSRYHAQDIRDDTPERHNPWPAASGQAPVSDGSKYIATDIITQAEFDYSFYIGGHCPVTLDADAALILDLQGSCTPAQEIGLDTQQPTYVFIGPSFMPPDEPTFRPMYIEELANVTTTAPIGDGEVLTFDGGSGQWVNEDPVRHNRIVTTLTAGTYTLDSTYDVVVLDATAGDIEINLPQTAANDGLEYAFKRIDATANEVAIVAFDSVLLDSDGEILTDSDGEILTDSDGGGGDTIDGETIQYLDSQYLAIQIVADADGSSWWII